MTNSWFRTAIRLLAVLGVIDPYCNSRGAHPARQFSNRSPKRMVSTRWGKSKRGSVIPLTYSSQE